MDTYNYPSHRHSQTELRRGEAATCGAKPDPAPPPRQMRLISWKAVRKTLRGFAAIELPGGLRIADCPVLVSKGKAWAALPSKPMLDTSGQQARDANGKPAYVAFMWWRDRDLADRFSAAVVGLVRAEHPDAFE